MKKIILTYGTIAGIILIIMFGVNIALMKGESSMGLSELLGYASMILALSMVFIGTKKYRDQVLEGNISFGKAFKVGILITLLASIFYVIGWMVLSGIFFPDFYEVYGEQYLADLQRGGATVEELAKAREENEKWQEIFKNPLAQAGMSFVEIFPIGVIVTLISSFILKKNNG